MNGQVIISDCNRREEGLTHMLKRFFILLFCAVALALPARAAEPWEQIDWPKYQDLAVTWLQEYLRVNTTNPPGNELRAAQFFKRIFDEEGIENEVFEYLPGRANLIARIRGNGLKRPLILLNHLDVVTSDPARWSVDPFAGVLRDGMIIGRGAQDMKGEGLIQAVTMVILQREKISLARDVIFLATADEEVNDSGSAWMIANKKEPFANAEYLLTEGGTNLLEDGHVRYFGVGTAEKAPLWLRLTATGRPGHGSRPIVDSAPNRLVRALARVLDYQTPVRILPAVEKFFTDMARYEPGERAAQFRHIREAVKDPRFLATLENDEFLNYMLRATISLTMLEGSQQTNVIPGRTSANLDVRLLPGDDPEAFIVELRRVVSDPDIQIERMNQFKPPNSSPLATELMQAIEAAVARVDPGAIVTTRMGSGYTESQMYRSLGITCYGFSPFLTTRAEQRSVHGDDERVSVTSLRQGVPLYFEVVARLARAR